jgi:hypothetical protein
MSSCQLSTQDPRDASEQRPLSVARPVAREIGRGRSAVVYRARDWQGRDVARKVFGAHGLTKAVQWVFLGTPNPYLWCADAAECALLRRRILAELVEAWLDGHVGVAAAHDLTWNDQHHAFELHTAYVVGRPVLLKHPLRATELDELDELRTEVMQPLQERLLEAGFDGMVWQAGYGNPVALNNFLREDDGDSAGRWIWIDMESGVPALASPDPRRLFGFYVPRSWRLGRAMFDDVDIDRLRDYLQRESAGLSERLGDERLRRVDQLVDELELRQHAWKSVGRFESAIRYRVSQGELDESRANWYRQRPLRWYMRETVHGAASVTRKIGTLSLRLARRVAGIDFAGIGVGIVQFLTSERYREALARRLVTRRLAAWRKRGQMSRPHAASLRRQMDSHETSAYLTDFGVHLAIKPFVKSFEYWFVPGLYAFGVINEVTVALVLLTAGAVARSLYTAGRMIQASTRGHECPWVALAVGALPVVGNFAYPLQIVYSSTETEDDLARFILYDGFARIGGTLPIWGGRDTLTEHACNRLPDRVVRLRRKTDG